MVVKVDTGFNKELKGLFSAGGGRAAELGVYPGQSDLPQEVPRLRGGEHAGGKAAPPAAKPVL